MVHSSHVLLRIYSGVVNIIAGFLRPRHRHALHFCHVSDRIHFSCSNTQECHHATLPTLYKAEKRQHPLARVAGRGLKWSVRIRPWPCLTNLLSTTKARSSASQYNLILALLTFRAECGCRCTFRNSHAMDMSHARAAKRFPPTSTRRSRSQYEWQTSERLSAKRDKGSVHVARH